MDEKQVQDTENKEAGQDPATDKQGDVEKEQAFDKLLKEKRAANREAQELKKALADLQAKNKEYEDKDKSETEKALARAQAAEKAMLDAEKRRADVEAKLLHQERLTLALGGGVRRQYADYVAQELRKQEAEENFVGAEKYFEGLRKENPAFFGMDEKPAPGSAGGGARPGGKGNRVVEIEEEIALLEKGGKRSSFQVDQKLFQLRLEKSRLQRDEHK